MGIVNGYTDLIKLKSRLGITDETEDDVLEAIVESVSRAIDGETDRQFYAATQTRYYTALSSACLLVDDLLSVTTLKTDDDGDGVHETTWAATDYLLAPYNAVLASTPGPYWRVELGVGGTRWLPVGVRRGVEIVGSWGYSATPPRAVASACLFQAALELRSSYAPAGSSGSGDTAQDIRLTGLHPVTRRLLEPYRRAVVA